MTSTKFDGKKGANRSQGPGDAASRSPAHSTLRARLPPSVLQGSSTMQAPVLGQVQGHTETETATATATEIERHNGNMNIMSIRDRDRDRDRDRETEI